MWYFAKNSVVAFGGNTIAATPVLVAYERDPVLSLVVKGETGYLGVDCRLYDSNGNGIATVKHNQIYLHEGKKDSYRVDGDVNRYTLVDKDTGEIFIDVKVREAAEPMALDIAAKLYLPNGVLFHATPDAVLAPTHNEFRGNVMRGFAIAFNVTQDGGLQMGVA